MVYLVSEDDRAAAARNSGANQLNGLRLVTALPVEHDRDSGY